MSADRQFAPRRETASGFEYPGGFERLLRAAGTEFSRPVPDSGFSSAPSQTFTAGQGGFFQAGQAPAPEIYAAQSQGVTGSGTERDFAGKISGDGARANSSGPAEYRGPESAAGKDGNAAETRKKQAGETESSGGAEPSGTAKAPGKAEASGKAGPSDETESSGTAEDSGEGEEETGNLAGAPPPGAELAAAAPPPQVQDSPLTEAAPDAGIPPLANEAPAEGLPAFAEIAGEAEEGEAPGRAGEAAKTGNAQAGSARSGTDQDDSLHAGGRALAGQSAPETGENAALAASGPDGTGADRAGLSLAAQAAGAAESGGTAGDAAGDTAGDAAGDAPPARRTVVELRDYRTGNSASRAESGEARNGSGRNFSGEEGGKGGGGSAFSFDLRSLARSAAEGSAASPERQESFQNLLARELRQNLSGDIVRQAGFVLRDGGEGVIRLTLHPESLGNVKIRLEMAENRITGTIVVESEEALQAFRQEIGSLEQAFRSSGYDGAELQMSLAGGGAGDRGDSAGDGAAPWFSDRLVRESWDSASAWESGFAAGGDGAVNVLV